MGNIEIVVKMSEEEYDIIKNYTAPMTWVEYLIKKGTLLPKGHGRLIDADKYRKDMQDSREFNFFATLDFQRTIIEADREAEE